MKVIFISLMMIFTTGFAQSEMVIKKDMIFKTFNIEWQTPQDAENAAKEYLSTEGTITVSNMTNQLIIYDYPDNIYKIAHELKKFDSNERYEKITATGSGQFSIKGVVRDKKREEVLPFGFIVVDNHEVKKESLTQVFYRLKSDPPEEVKSKDVGLSIFVRPRIVDTKKIDVQICIVEKKLVGWTDEGEPIVDNYTSELQGIIQKSKPLKLTAKEFNRSKYYIEMNAELNVDKMRDLSVSYY